MPSVWLTKVFALVPLVALATLWAEHHLGLGTVHTGAVALVTTLLAGALTFITKAVDKTELESAEKKGRDWVQSVLTWPRIGVLYLGAGLAALAFSTVIVVPDDSSPAAAKVVLKPRDATEAHNARLEPKGEPARFPVSTSPFGRLFDLEVDGYVPEVIEVFPIVGRTVRPDRDLRRAPALLIRLSPFALGSLGNEKKGQVVVLQRGGAKDTRIAESREARGAFLLGRPSSTPPTQYASWQIELAARGIGDPKVASATMREWSTPQALPASIVLAPGMKLVVQVMNGAGNLVASSEVVLGNTSLQDLSVEDIP